MAATVQLVDTPDPFDPTTPTGAVARLTVRPPHFFFRRSEYGMTLDRFTLDLSKAFTPADVVTRGHDETWQGVAFKEATFYTPRFNEYDDGERSLIFFFSSGRLSSCRCQQDVKATDLPQNCDALMLTMLRQNVGADHLSVKQKC